MLQKLHRFVPTEEQIRMYRRIHNGMPGSPRNVCNMFARTCVDRSTAITRLNDAVTAGIRRGFIDALRIPTDDVEQCATDGFPGVDEVIIRGVFTEIDRYHGAQPYRGSDIAERLRQLFSPYDQTRALLLAKSVVAELKEKLSLSAELHVPDSSGKRIIVSLGRDARFLLKLST